METFVEVTKEKFFTFINHLDIHPKIINEKYPYISLWETRYPKQTLGKTFDGKYFLTIKEY